MMHFIPKKAGRMKKLQLAVVLVAIAASVAVSWAIRQRADAASREREAHLQGQAEELSALEAENGRLGKLVEELKTAQPLSKEQLGELLRLRGQVGQLRREAADKPKLAAANEELKEAQGDAAKELAVAQAMPNYWAKDQLAFAGFGDPASAMKSILWSMSKGGSMGDWRSFATPEAIAQLEAEERGHQRSPAEIEEDVKQMSAALVGPSEGFHIVDQQMIGDDKAVVNLSFDGEGRARRFVLRKMGGEWKFDRMLFEGEEAK
jgi:hypothetical protein